MEVGFGKVFEFGVHEHSLAGNSKNMLATLSIMLIWTIVASYLFVALGANTNEIRGLIAAKLSIYNAILPASFTVSRAMSFFMVCILAPLWEELAFRYAPLVIARSLETIFVRNLPHTIRRQNGVEYDYERGYLYGNLGNAKFIFPAMLLSSIIFGLGHGSVINIMFQGVGGFVLAWLMIKSGYWSAVITHSLWNTILMLGLPVLSK